MSESLKLFNEDMEGSRFQAKLIGLDILSGEKYKINTITVINFLTGFSYVVIVQFYSFYYHRNDFDNLLFCCVTTGYGWQCFGLLNVVYLFRSDFVKFYKRAVEFQKEHQHRPVLLEYTKMLTRVNYAATATFMSVGIVLTFFPIIISFYKNEYIKNCGYLLPYFDLHELGGYLVNLVYEYFLVYFVLLGTCSNCRIYSSMVVHACTEIDVIKEMLQELRNVLETKNGKRVEDSKVTEMINNIVRAHHQHFEFMALLENVGYITLFIQQISTIFVMSTGLFVMLKSETVWYPGYFILFMSTMQFLLNCMFGTIVENKIDELCRAVYENSWYEMSVKDQKKILFILKATQKNAILSFGKFSKVNVSTFLTVYKTIYSFVMMIRKTQ